MRLVVFFTLFPSLAFANAIDCSKKNGIAECSIKEGTHKIRSIVINGGECDSPYDNKLYSRTLVKSDKFKVPGSKECFYVRMIDIYTTDGKMHRQTAL